MEILLKIHDVWHGVYGWLHGLQLPQSRRKPTCNPMPSLADLRFGDRVPLSAVCSVEA
jgi:hypothetical protein